MKISITTTTKDWLIIKLFYNIFMVLILIADYYMEVLNWGTVFIGICVGFQTAMLIVDYGNYKYPKELKKDTPNDV